MVSSLKTYILPNFCFNSDLKPMTEIIIFFRFNLELNLFVCQWFWNSDSITCMQVQPVQKRPIKFDPFFQFLLLQVLMLGTTELQQRV